jgi:hypothetical protein
MSVSDTSLPPPPYRSTDDPLLLEQLDVITLQTGRRVARARGENPASDSRLD